ncbi:MAG TPA: YtpI family protein [Candidatus Dormibacteraeota bacterium]|nr:YtpI family protein [Candidatus Dormibacteraeota bacterium]
MFVVALLIMISIVLYIYYKVSILRTSDQLSQVYFNAKARICLGSFIFFFAINQYLLYGTKISLFIGIIFLIFGILQINRGYKEAKHYRKEWKRLEALEQ